MPFSGVHFWFLKQVAFGETKLCKRINSTEREPCLDVIHLNQSDKLLDNISRKAII